MSLSLERITARAREVQERVRALCLAHGRDPDSVRVLAVTKSQGPEVLPALRAAGIRDFGENRVDHLELMRPHGEPGDRWHYIGRVQGRQLAKIAPSIACLHSLCQPDHIPRLARACAALGRRLPVFVQVNTSGEASKAGVSPDDLPAFLDAVRRHAELEVIGLMTMAPELGVHADEAAVSACFSAARRLAHAYGLRELSMGMSSDWQLAIAEGATIIRIGSLLFAHS